MKESSHYNFKEGNPDELQGIPVRTLDSLREEERQESVVYIGVSNDFRHEVEKDLISRGLTNIEYPNLSSLKHKEFSHVPKKRFLAMWYWCVTGRELDWNHLETYNEKMQWIKLYDNPQKKTALVDKYLVREYVKDKVGEQYLVPLYGVWDSFDDIDFDKLPDKFVLKCNHGSGWNLIVEDKNSINIDIARERFKRWLNTEYYDEYGLEMQYEGVKPCIIAEGLLEEDSGVELRDYKFFVFHGKVKLIQVDIDRKQHHRRNLYTENWEYLPYSIHYETAPDVIVEKPDRLEEMKALAISLSEGFMHTRVDFYYCNSRIYFGEITFTHGSGAEIFNPYDFAYEMGSWLHLPKGN